MAPFLNDYDLSVLDANVTSDTPNLRHLVDAVGCFMYWTDHNSDGWVYWTKPRQAAKRAIERLLVTKEEIYTDPWALHDLTRADVTAMLRPIRAFLTRQGVDHADVIPPHAIPTR